MRSVHAQFVLKQKLLMIKYVAVCDPSWMGIHGRSYGVFNKGISKRG